MAQSKRRYGPAEKELWVEGLDDLRVVKTIFGKHGVPEQFQVEERGGWPNIRQTLEQALRAGNQKQIGVILDAEDDFNGRWSSIKALLLGLGYPDIPDSPGLQGTILAKEEATTVGVWLMPDNLSSGMLEDFAHLLLPPLDKLWERAVQAVEGIPDEERLFKSTYLSKAKIHTWLAWQKEPGKPMGQALNVGYLQPNAEPAQRLVAWIKRLFNLEELR